MGKIEILDTTLRDGEQAPGMAIDSAHKTYLASVLDSLGVDVIELGFPAASKRDFESVSAACAGIKTSQAAALARITEYDIDAAWNALMPAQKKRLHITISTSALHMEKKLHMKSADVIKAAVHAVKYGNGRFDSIEIGAEDASRSDPDFLAEFFCAVSEAGASVLNIADTVGYSKPEEFGNLVRMMRKKVPAVKEDRAIISVHCHDDLGLALANTVAGIEAGAGQAEVSLLGLGERAGNTALEELLVYLETRTGTTTSINDIKLGGALRAASMIFCMPPAKNKAIAGANAFSHGSGMHQNGVLKEPLSYEIINPAKFGIEPGGIIISRHSGKSGLAARLKKLSGMIIDDEIVQSMMKSIEEGYVDKKVLSDTDLLLLMQSNGIYTDIVFSFDDIEVMSIKENGGVKYRTYLKLLTKGGRAFDSLAEGSTPFEAIFEAVKKCTGSDFKPVYFSFSAAGNRNECTSSFYLETERRGKIERAEAYADDLYKAAALACVDIANRINAARAKTYGKK